MYKTTVLLLLVLVSALAVVTVRHLNRQAYLGLQKTEQVTNELHDEWGRLMIERTTRTVNNNVFDEAIQRRAMIVPDGEAIITMPLAGGGNE